MKKIITLLLLCCFGSLLAQKLTHYTTKEGLPDNIMYNILQDADGYMWFGTDDGLVKFDGKKFFTYTTKNGLSNNYVIDIKQYAKDTLMLAVWGGGLHFLTHDTIYKPLKSDFLKSNELLVLNKNIYTQHGNNSFIYQKKSSCWTLETFGIDTLKKKIEIPSNQSLLSSKLSWVNNEILLHHQFRIKNNEKQLSGVYGLSSKNKLISKFPHVKNKTILNIINHLNFFIASDKNELLFFDKTKIISSKKLAIGDREIVKIISFSNEEIGILCANKKGFKELYIFNLTSNKLKNFRDKYAIESTISDILKDFENNIWITTFGDGIYQLKSTKNAVKTVLYNTNITKLLPYKNTMYALAPEKLLEFGVSETKTYPTNNFAKDLHIYNDTVYVSSFIDKDTIKLKDKIFEINGLFNYHSNELLVNSKRKLYINKQLETRIPNSVNNVLELANEVYFTTKKGLFIYNKVTKSIKPSPFKELQDIYVTDIVKKDDVLWVATNKGLTRIVDNQILKFTINDGLPSNNIKDLLISSDKKLWIATSKGISMFDGTFFLNINIDDNLISNNVTYLAEDKKQDIWIATSNGISIFKNTTNNTKEVPPIINVKQKLASFNIDVISYNNSNTLFTQYQINEQPWVTLSANQINFNNYKEGTYNFAIRSKKLNSAWQYSNNFTFTIKIPFYKKWVFIFLIIVLFLSMITIVISYQLKKSKAFNNKLVYAIQKQKTLENKLNTVRENIAQDFHDDLGNKLASITVLTDILSNSIKTDKEKKIIYQIQENSDSLYKGTKDFIWSLSSKSDYLEELVTYLSDFGEDFFLKMDISFRINKNLTENVVLPYYWSRHIILIFKEAMTNIVKHANSKRCEIAFSYKENLLRIKLSDDGLGFDVKNLKHQNGILNMQKRAAKIGGVLEIKTSEKGTQILFLAKLTSKNN